MPAQVHAASPTARRCPIANVRGEISYEKVAGTLEFTVNGQKMSFDALDDDGDLFIIFRDGTSNSTTYPPGRFLVVEKPKDGTDGSSTSTRRTTRPARSRRTRHVRCRRRRTG